MHKDYILIQQQTTTKHLNTFYFMTTFLNGHWQSSNFFRNKDSSYSIRLVNKDSQPLSENDSNELISILSKYEWEEDKGNFENTLEMNQVSWGRYHFYYQSYLIYVTHIIAQTFCD